MSHNLFQRHTSTHSLSTRSLCAALLLVTGLAGCVTPPKPVTPSGTTATTTAPTVRTGRLSLQVQQEAAPQSFIVAFELTGDARNGSLRLFGPLGSIMAIAQWSPTTATLQHMGRMRTFDSLDALLETLTGAPLPSAALFDWLNGHNTEADGWKADLSQYPKGKIRAQRHQPQPAATLQMVLQ